MNKTKVAWFSGLLMVAGLAWAGEFDNLCTMGLAMGQNVRTDCAVNWTGKDGKTYCFGNEEAKRTFLKDSESNLKKAKDYYAKSKAK